MRKILFFAAMALAVLQACEKSDTHKSDAVSKEAKQALAAKYPGVGSVSWQSKNGYVVASFTYAAVRAASEGQLNAWFDNQGTWYMTETDIRFELLPEAVKTAFAASVYAAWQVDEVDMIERNGTETVYIIEVKQADKEMELYYSPDGVLIKEMADVDDDYDYEDYIPNGQNASIEGYIKANYPDARILEIDREGSYTEVEILDGRVKRELVFDGSGKWLRTKTELRATEVPKVVMQVLQASKYASYRIDDVDHYITAASEHYRFELKSASGDVKIEITAAGVLTEVGNESDDDYTGSLNQTCADFIAKQYSGAKIIESEYEHGYLEVEIRHDNREKTVRFNAANEWVDTRWDIRRNELPQAVTNAIAASDYASYEIDDAEYVQAPSGDYYRIELEKNDREATMHIKADGTVM